jgi:ectoine hydroxylase-related dioxygenase (phytanoyl-CoA dioxygenase family)
MRFARKSAFPTKEVLEEAAAAQERVFSDIDRLALWSVIGELDANGYAVIPPELTAAPAGFAGRLAEALLDTSKRITGIDPDVSEGTTHADYATRHGNVQIIEPLLQHDPIFIDALMNDSLLAVVSYLLGESCVLLGNSGQIKGPGDLYLPLHNDLCLTAGPTLFSATAQVCNASWVLSDYSAEDGATAFLPGSHKLLRYPTEPEIRDPANYQPVNAKAGSILVWHGNTWHGASPRTRPGLRLSIIHFFGRSFLRPNPMFAKLVAPEEVARRPARFGRLIGAESVSREQDAVPRDESARLPASVFGIYG